jgi:hypothetical protein
MSYTPYRPSVVIENQVTYERIRLFVDEPARLLTPASYQIIDYELAEGTTLADYQWSGLFTVYNEIRNDVPLQTTCPLYPEKADRVRLQAPPTVMVPSAAYAGQLRIPVRLIYK